jgi:hypothetical protein
MSVRLSANHIAPAGGGFEPQRRYDWFLMIPGIAMDPDELRLSMVSAFLPVQENEVITLKYGNMEVHVAGGMKFDAGEIKVRDYVDKDTYASLMDWFNTVGNAADGTTGFAAEYKVTGQIQLVTPDDSGNPRVYSLYGLWPFKISGGDLTYANQNDTLEVSMSLRFDRAVYENAGQNG